MKLFTILMTALAVAGCTLDVAQTYNPELRLMFQPDMLMHAAAEDVAGFPMDQTIGVSAWKLQESECWADCSDSAEDYLVRKKASSSEVEITDIIKNTTVTDVLWVIDEQPVWPDEDEHLTFMAFSPFEAACGCDRKAGVTYTIDVAQDQTDLLYTDPLADVNKLKDGWVVPLHFRHALSKVSFRVKNRVADDESIEIHSITIDGVRHKGSFASLADPQWTTEEATTVFEVYEGNFETGHQPEPVGRTWLMIPHRLDTQVSVRYKYTTFASTHIVQNLKTVSLRASLEPGKNYVFTLSVGIDDVKFLTEIIEDRLD